MRCTSGGTPTICRTAHSLQSSNLFSWAVHLVVSNSASVRLVSSTARGCAACSAASVSLAAQAAPTHAEVALSTAGGSACCCCWACWLGGVPLLLPSPVLLPCAPLSRACHLAVAQMQMMMQVLPEGPLHRRCPAAGAVPAQHCSKPPPLPTKTARGYNARAPRASTRGGGGMRHLGARCCRPPAPTGRHRRQSAHVLRSTHVAALVWLQPSGRADHMHALNGCGPTCSPVMVV